MRSIVGQRVHGTTARLESTVVVAISNDKLAVAAQKFSGAPSTNSTLSVRVEDLTKGKTVFAELDKSYNPFKASSKGHASVHLELGKKHGGNASSVLMAVLGTVNQSFSLIAPSKLAMSSIMGEE